MGIVRFNVTIQLYSCKSNLNFLKLFCKPQITLFSDIDYK